MDKLLQNKTVLRIIALVLACVLWLSVNAPANNPSGNTGIVDTFPKQVTVKADSGLLVTSNVHPTAMISITTDPLHALTLRSEMLGVSLVADAEGLGPGTHVVHLVPINMPNNLTYTIIPLTTTVVLQQETSADRPVSIQVNGQPAGNDVIGKPNPSLTEVTITGASAAIAKVAAVIGIVSIDGASASVSKAVALTAVDENGRPVQNVQVTPSSISVTVPVTSKVTNVPLSPQIVGTPAAGFAIAGVTLNQSHAILYLSSGTNAPSSLSIPIDVSGIRTTQTVQVKVPPIGGITKVIPDLVQATVQVEASQEIDLKALPITVRNEANGVNVTVQSGSTVNVKLSGPVSIIRSLTQNDVQAYVDASGVQKGSTISSLPIHIQVPDWVSVVQLSASSVPVTVQ